MRLTQYRFLFALLSLMLMNCSRSSGQVATGTPPFGSFNGGPDIVNIENLNVHIPIPVFNKAGRNLPFAYNYGYDSSVWYPGTTSDGQAWTAASLFGWMNFTQPATGFI